jgi:hypothetical protein
MSEAESSPSNHGPGSKGLATLYILNIENSL